MRVGRWKNLILFLPLIPMSFSLSALARKEAEPRHDLSSPLARIYCHQKTSPQELWKENIFEGQLDGMSVTSSTYQPLKEADLWERARSIAAIRHSGGYAAGLCDPNHGFIVTMPAFESLKAEADKIVLPTHTLASECKEWNLDYARIVGGISRKIKIEELNSTWRSLEPGVISVTCRPRSPRWLGARTWYFVPVQKESLLKSPLPEQHLLSMTPLANNPKNDGEMIQQLLAWIQKIRQKEQLPPFQIDHIATQAAHALLVNPTIDHNTSLLNKTKQKFQTPQVILIGENRVQGVNKADIAWMLWHSPKHRDLLLRKSPPSKMPLIGIASTTISNELLVAIVVGEGNLVDVAHRPQAKETVRQ